MANKEMNNNNIPLRENLINTAVKFLQNPKISGSPSEQKQEFLIRKGLTNDEVKRAFELASIEKVETSFIKNQNEFTAIAIPPQPQIHPYYQVQTLQPTLFYKIKEFFNATALIGATVYCVYWLYKKFIAPFLFGFKKPKTVEDSVTKLDETIQNSMKEVKDSILKVDGDVNRLTQRHSMEPTIPHLVQELKQDLASLKALLLSRKQFPNAPASIPSWQLQPSSSNPNKSNDSEDDTGSGSSTNNSDSSLEMIREDPSKE
ncbi:peroxisomal membrane protein PEX14 [Cephus cinctus]|uniref:Peroxisomal membrane protein PEX14 n=1 Tax=Cephus cinctus TaxID=211228 RepID=A0AAJ7FHZ0_CEPCN|nr:peroxisomal membrane protein PEX14 [Cephus cinctus]